MKRMRGGKKMEREAGNRDGLCYMLYRINLNVVP